MFPSEVSAVLFSLDFVFSIRISLNVKITWASWLGIITGIHSPLAIFLSPINLQSVIGHDPFYSAPSPLFLMFKIFGHRMHPFLFQSRSISVKSQYFSSWFFFPEVETQGEKVTCFCPLAHLVLPRMPYGVCIQGGFVKVA